MRNFCLTCGKFAPEPGFYVYSGPVCQCLNPTLGRQLLDALKEANQAQKPDASPREWTLLFKGDGYFEPHVLGAEPSDFPKAGKRTFDVIEKSYADALEAKYAKQISEYAERANDDIEALKEERDTLEKRVALYEQRFEKADDLANELAAANETIKALRHEMRMQGGAVKERDAAKAEIERLQHVINYDMPHPQLTQANARIAELEAELQKQKDFRLAMQKAMDEDSEREAKLVAALEEIEAASHYADELENIRPIAIEALKAHTASAEKGGA